MMCFEVHPTSCGNFKWHFINPQGTILWSADEVFPRDIDAATAACKVREQFLTVTAEIDFQ